MPACLTKIIQIQTTLIHNMKPLTHKRILILADIEGSSNCHDYDSTTFLGNQWPQACQGMTRDTNAVVKALFKAGIEKIYIKDFYPVYPGLVLHTKTLLST